MEHEARAICCIDHQAWRLYAELIQVVEARQIAWLRPLALVEHRALPSMSMEDWQEAIVYDLQGEADLLCPRILLREALDTEVVPLLSRIAHNDKPSPGRLRQFLQQLYADMPERFSPSGD